jgi:hypothetical protein
VRACSAPEGLAPTLKAQGPGTEFSIEQQSRTGDGMIKMFTLYL